MLMPWRIKSAADRTRAAAAFADFRGAVLIPAGLSQGDAQTLTRHMIERIRTETDPDHDIWIVTGRIEHPRWMLSLLHARVDQSQGATIDLLIAVPESEFKAPHPYKGYGEFALLTLLLEQMNVTRLNTRLKLDDEETGMLAAGWLPAGGNVYVHSQERAGRPEAP